MTAAPIAASRLVLHVIVVSLVVLSPCLVAPCLAATTQEDEEFDELPRTSLREQSSYPVVAPTSELRQQGIERYQPALCAMDQDKALCVFVSWKVGEGDRVVALDLSAARIGNSVNVTAAAGQYAWPCVADLPGREPQVFWFEIGKGVTKLMTARRLANGRGWEPPVVLTPVVGTCSRPAVLAHAGRLWIAWESYAPPIAPGERGGADVFLAPVEGTALGAVLRAGDGRFGDVAPTLAGTSDGRVWLAWSRYEGRDFEIVARALDPASSKLSEIVAVSRDPLADDLHPALAAGADGRLWVAWDAVRDVTRGRSWRYLEGDPPRGSEATLRVACIDAAGVADLLESDDRSLLEAGTLLSWSGGLPQLAVRPDGSLLFAHRYFEQKGDPGPSHSYPLLLRTLSAGAATAATLLGESEGNIEEAALAATAGGIWIACSADGHPQETHLRLHTRIPAAIDRKLEEDGFWLRGTLGPSRLVLHFMPWSSVNPGGEPGATPAVRPRPVADAAAPPPAHPAPPSHPAPQAHPLGAPEADPLLFGGAHREYAGGTTPRFAYFGDLHRHSSGSRCLNGLEARASDRYLYARDVWLDDFFALTDHPAHIDPLGLWQQCKLVDLAASPAFCVFQGFEWSSQPYGHENVIFRRRLDRFVTTLDDRADEPEKLWSLLSAGEAITIPHHTGHAKMPMDWDHCDPAFVPLVEVFQSARGSYEFPGCFRQADSVGAEGSAQDALQRGLKLGFIASSDHGNGAAYAVALAERLETGALFDALVQRRTFASTTKGLFVDFRIDGTWMGGELTTAAAPHLVVDAWGTRDLAEVVIFRDGAIARALGRAPSPAAAGATLSVALRWWLPKWMRDIEKELVVRVDRGRIALAPPPDPAAATPRDTACEVVADGDAALRITFDAAYTRNANVSFRIDAPDDATLTLTVEEVEERVPIASLRSGRVAGSAGICGRWLLVGGDGRNADPVEPGHGMGVRTLHDEWSDTTAAKERTWYYARVVDTAGEISWSSPIFVSRE